LITTETIVDAVFHLGVDAMHMSAPFCYQALASEKVLQNLEFPLWFLPFCGNWRRAGFFFALPCALPPPT
jgi:hypothetical protein